MIDSELSSDDFRGAEKISKYFEERLHLEWPEYNGQPALIKAYLVRNCIVHNGDFVNSRLAKVSDWKEGDRIKLSTVDVHDYGFEARAVAYELWQAAFDKHLQDDGEIGSS
jgi:hypothetical protein